MGTLAQSMALMLEEFYKTLTAVGVSALTGDGMDGFFHAVDAAAQEYESTYAKELKERKQKRQKEEAERQARDTQKFQADRAAEGGASMEASGASVVLDGTARGGDDEGLEARRRPHEGTAEEDAYEHAGFTAADEEYNRQLAAEDQEEYASLQRFLQAEREKRAEREGAAGSGPP